MSIHPDYYKSSVEKAKEIHDRKFYRTWPVPFLAVLIRFSKVSGRIQNTERRKTKSVTRPLTRQREPEVHDVIYCPLYFRWSGSFEYRKLYHLYKQKHFLFDEELGILLQFCNQFWNSASRIKLTGRGFRYSGNVAEFSGEFSQA